MDIEIKRGAVGNVQVPEMGSLPKWKISPNADGTYLSTDGTTSVTVELNPPENSDPKRRRIALSSDRFVRTYIAERGEGGVNVYAKEPGSERRLVDIKRNGISGATNITFNEILRVTL